MRKVNWHINSKLKGGSENAALMKLVNQMLTIMYGVILSLNLLTLPMFTFVLYIALNAHYHFDLNIVQEYISLSWIESHFEHLSTYQTQ